MKDSSDRRLALLLRLTLLAAAVLPALVIAPRFPVEGGKAFVGMMLTGGALIAAALTAINGHARLSRGWIPVIPLVAAAAGAACVAPDRAVAIVRAADLTVWAALIVLAAGMGELDRRWLPRLAGAVALAGVMAAGFMLASLAGLGGLVSLEAGTFGTRNTLGHFLALALWPLLAWLLAARRWPMRAALLLGTGVVAQALLMTRSKGAWLALPVALGAAAMLMGVFRWPRPELPRRIRSLAALLLAGGAALAVIFALRHPALLQGEASTLAWDSQSLGVRLGLWRGTLRMIADYPVLGVGLGQWPMAFPPYLSPEHFVREMTRPREAHCDWLQWIAETGLLGSAALAVLIVWTWRTARRCPPSIFAWSAILSLLSLAFIAAVDFPMQQAVPAMLAAMILGALAGARASAAPPRRSAALFLVFGILAGLALTGGMRGGLVASHLGAIRAAAEGRGGSHEGVMRHIASLEALGVSPLEAARMASAAMRFHEPRLAEAVLHRALQRDLAWYENWRLRAEALLAMGETEQAHRAAEWAVSLGSELASPWLTLAKVRHVLGDQPGAIAALEEAQARAAGDPEGELLLGQWLLQAGRAAEAQQALERSTAGLPGRAEGWVLLGEARFQQGASDEARAAFARATQEDPEQVTGWRRLATLELRAGQSASAEAHLQRALALEPRSPELLHLMGTAYATQWKLTEARRVLEEAVAIDPACAPAWQGLGLLCAQEGSPEAGIEPLLRSYRLDPENAVTRGALRALGVEPAER